MVGIDDDLNRDEYVPLFRDKMEYYVLKRIEQAFKANPGAAYTWGTISIENLHKVMVSEFGKRLTDVSNVLSQFGPSRVNKSAEESVS